MSESGRWRMFAHRYADGDLHNLGVRRFVEFHGASAPIVEVDVAEVGDEDPAATHWGWMRPADTQPVMIYPREVLFRVCFAYGVEAEVAAGKGRVVRLAVTEIRGNAADGVDKLKAEYDQAQAAWAAIPGDRPTVERGAAWVRVLAAYDALKAVGAAPLDGEA